MTSYHTESRGRKPSKSKGNAAEEKKSSSGAQSARQSVRKATPATESAELIQSDDSDDADGARKASSLERPARTSSVPFNVENSHFTL